MDHPLRGGRARPRIVVLIAGGPLANMLVNGLAQRFGSLSILKEDPEPKFAIVRRRARLVGWSQAAGQAAFGLLQKIVQHRSAARLAAIWQQHGLNPCPPRLGWQQVGSVNAPACRAALRDLDPDVVVVYGTRIIKWRTLGCVAAPFINYHAGINPKYRGQNGAYWARSQHDRAHAGVTVHLVDQGIDTGSVLYQAPVEFAPDDNIATYQHRQMAAALPLLVRAIEDALKGQLRPRHIDLPSKQWFHPTLWGYLKTGMVQQVW
ncbi:MAG: formyl transferase [Hyphomicrobiaceae bacterium]|nr:MAG: formyl transferase [Hyphomicrobiaceae bacterium]